MEGCGETADSVLLCSSFLRLASLLPLLFLIVSCVFHPSWIPPCEILLVLYREAMTRQVPKRTPLPAEIILHIFVIAATDLSVMCTLTRLSSTHNTLLIPRLYSQMTLTQHNIQNFLHGLLTARKRSALTHTTHLTLTDRQAAHRLSDLPFPPFPNLRTLTTTPLLLDLYFSDPRPTSIDSSYLLPHPRISTADALRRNLAPKHLIIRHLTDEEIRWSRPAVRSDTTHLGLAQLVTHWSLESVTIHLSRGDVIPIVLVGTLRAVLPDCERQTEMVLQMLRGLMEAERAWAWNPWAELDEMRKVGRVVLVGWRRI